MHTLIQIFLWACKFANQKHARILGNLAGAGNYLIAGLEASEQPLYVPRSQTSQCDCDRVFLFLFKDQNVFSYWSS